MRSFFTLLCSLLALTLLLGLGGCNRFTEGVPIPDDDDTNINELRTQLQQKHERDIQTYQNQQKDADALDEDRFTQFMELTKDVCTAIDTTTSDPLKRALDDTMETPLTSHKTRAPNRVLSRQIARRSDRHI